MVCCCQRDMHVKEAMAFVGDICSFQDLRLVLTKCSHSSCRKFLLFLHAVVVCGSLCTLSTTARTSKGGTLGAGKAKGSIGKNIEQEHLQKLLPGVSTRADRTRAQCFLQARFWPLQLLGRRRLCRCGARLLPCFALLCSAFSYGQGKHPVRDTNTCKMHM